MANREKDDVTGTETTGHEWDGIKELDTPLPRWWLWTFYATIVVAAVWWVLYPSWPTLSSYWPGLLETNARKELQADLAVREAERAQWVAKFQAMSVEDIAQDGELLNYAMAGGKAIFADNCAPCHGSQGSGAPGYPVLADDAWLWGGTLNAIETTIRYGIRSTHEDTRMSDMPVFGADYLERADIRDVAQYVLSLSGGGENHDAAERGEDIFEEECAACHGEDGEGLKAMGAPRLNDGIWLYGGTQEDVIAQISKPKHGVMPAWQGRLDDVSIKQVTVYVHGLGGGR